MFALLTSLKHQSVPKCSVTFKHNLDTCHKDCLSNLGLGHHLKGRRIPPEAYNIFFGVVLWHIYSCSVSKIMNFQSGGFSVPVDYRWRHHRLPASFPSPQDSLESSNLLHLSTNFVGTDTRRKGLCERDPIPKRK